jgi:hypothetical protein
MKTLLTAVVAALMATTAHAHEWTPTYPTFEASFMEGIVVTTMKIFNKRSDVDYYELTVHDKDWKPIPFASTAKLLYVPYLGQKSVDIFIREIDCDRIEYICTTSKQLALDAPGSGVDSRICSKV